MPVFFGMGFAFFTLNFSPPRAKFKPLTSEVYQFELGEIQASYGHYHPVSFMDPGDSIVTLKQPGRRKIKLYEAKRVFQESYPFVDKVEISDNSISWNDGRLLFKLEIQEIPKEKSDVNVSSELDTELPAEEEHD